MLKAKGNEVLDETGKQLCIVLSTNCTKRDAQRWAQYIVDRVNADERGKSFATKPEGKL